MSPLFLTKVDTPNLYTGPSMLVRTYHLSTRISVNQYCSSNARRSVNTLSKITHRRIYLLIMYSEIQEDCTRPKIQEYLLFSKDKQT